MMREPHWHARIQAAGRVGAGFLIDTRHVLTAAHVVDGSDNTTVSFPGGRGAFDDLPASVLYRGEWARQGDYGDMAVLELAEPVAITPATLARPTELRTAGHGNLKIYGFRRGNIRTGSIATVRADWTQHVAGEWIQLTNTDGFGEELGKGFSGAAVYAPDADAVVGMVTDADPSPEHRIGLMLPIPSLRRHWEPLDDWLYPKWLDPRIWRELRALVQGSTTDTPLEEIYAKAFHTAKARFATVWESIRHVAEEHDLGEIAAIRLNAYLDALAPRLTRRAVADQIRRLFPGGRSEPHDASIPSIIVRVDHSGAGGYLLALSTWGTTRTRHVDFDPIETARQVRAQVEQELPKFLECVEGQEFLIEFVMPETWLDRPVDEWFSDPADREPLGLLYPVVIRDVRRLKPGVRREKAITRWRELRRAGAVAPDLFDCRDRRDDRALRALLAGDDHTVVIGAGSWKRQRRMALKYGVPIMLWSRRWTCAEHSTGAQESTCPGDRFVEQMSALVRNCAPDDLPMQVREVRRLAEGLDRDQCGRWITLFWDDPLRRPDPPLAMA
ncbi:trypsin-like peptidase domain-containing protein [Streptosporangiaceae bacterium NEAU-GS5]|nr:trypsin-like peptidase domain-containing protein [Streptosporangiaceae bacterium NEAU-GS5]